VAVCGLVPAAATAATPQGAVSAESLANAVISGQYQPTKAPQTRPAAGLRPSTAGAAASSSASPVATAARAARAAGAVAAPVAAATPPARTVHTNSRYQSGTPPPAASAARALRALRRTARARGVEPPAPANVNISIRIFSPGDDGAVRQVAGGAGRAAQAALRLAREGGARFSAAADPVRTRTWRSADDAPRERTGATSNWTWIVGGSCPRRVMRATGACIASGGALSSAVIPRDLRHVLDLLADALPGGQAAALKSAVGHAPAARGSPARGARGAAARKRRAAARRARAQAARAVPRAGAFVAAAGAPSPVAVRPAAATPSSTPSRSAAHAAPSRPAHRGGGSSRAPDDDRRQPPAPPPGAPASAGSAAGAVSGGPVSAPLSALPGAPALRLSSFSSRLPRAEVARRREPADRRLERPG
jgi:hypothetical protein